MTKELKPKNNGLYLMKNPESGKYIIKILSKKNNLYNGIIYTENREKVDNTSLTLEIFRREFVKKLTKKDDVTHKK